MFYKKFKIVTVASSAFLLRSARTKRDKFQVHEEKQGFSLKMIIDFTACTVFQTTSGATDDKCNRKEHFVQYYRVFMYLNLIKINNTNKIFSESSPE